MNKRHTENELEQMASVDLKLFQALRVSKPYFTYLPNNQMFLSITVLLSVSHSILNGDELANKFDKIFAVLSSSEGHAYFLGKELQSGYQNNQIQQIDLVGQVLNYPSQEVHLSRLFMQTKDEKNFDLVF